MSAFAAPTTITLTAAGTTEVTGTIPSGTNAVIVVCTMPAHTNFNFPSLSVGFATASAQMMAALNSAYRTSSAGQQGARRWNNAAIGSASLSLSSSFTDITITTFSGTTLGLTKAGATPTDVTATVYPIVASTTPDLREITSLVTSGTTANVTGLGFEPGALLYLSAGLGGSVTLNASHINIGMATGSAAQWSASVATSWNIDPNNVVSRVRTDRLGLMYDGINAIGYRPGQFTLSAVSSDGYTITQNDETNLKVFAVLAIPGDFALLTGAVPSTTGTVATTGAGGTPDSAFFCLNAFATTSDVEGDSFSLSFGGGTLATQRVAGLENVDNVSIPNPTAATASGAVMQGRSAGVQTSLAAIDSFDSDGLTLNWTDADATAGLWAALVSVSAAPSGPSAAALARYRRHHLLMEP